MTSKIKYELPKLEWLNKRGWKTFQDFMVTYGYNPQSVEDYMNAQALLCDYRASDPFANKEEQDGEEDKEELEELEDEMDYEDDEDNEEFAARTKKSTNNDVEAIGAFIKQDIRREKGKYPAEIEEVTDGMYMQDDSEYNAQIAASEGFFDKEGGGTEQKDVAGGDRGEGYPISLFAAQIRNSVQIEDWLCERGWANLYQFMVGHGLNFHDDELIYFVGSQFHAMIESGDQRGLEELLKGLTMGEYQHQHLETKHSSRNQWQYGQAEDMNGTNQLM
ncbi:hypothetical protein SBOR_5209 [Sclerotinia borealis F-4128]|uniref:Uncharacterized protein n=1 Tax=Sclerotinia borealis (strain F-4128) TaxID=1432307 RepID=W9CEY0_SCLBF|nr:hypothetical protein SBOR_5209 [Sclerotinia borealis F-4128]